MHNILFVGATDGSGKKRENEGSTGSVGARRRLVGAFVTVVLAAAVVLAGCGDEQSSGNTSNIPIYTCSNGTAASGTPTGTEDSERCASCAATYRLTDSTCSLPGTYTCSNGTVASGIPAGTQDVERCVSCATTHWLTDSTCLLLRRGLTNAGNGSAAGLWSDGTTMWVVDATDNKIYAYNISTKARDLAREFNNLAPNRFTTGIWSDGTTMWVGSFTHAKIFAYNMSTKARDPSQDFNTLRTAKSDADDAGNNNTNPRGIWSDGTIMWVVDSQDAKVYAYTLETKVREPAQSFSTSARNFPHGIWSDGTTIWVSDPARSNGHIYAYSATAPHPRDPSKDFNDAILHAAGNRRPRGLWSDGTTMWVADNEDNTIYAYVLETKARDPAKDFSAY